MHIIIGTLVVGAYLAYVGYQRINSWIVKRYPQELSNFLQKWFRPLQVLSVIAAFSLAVPGERFLMTNALSPSPAMYSTQTVGALSALFFVVLFGGISVLLLSWLDACDFRARCRVDEEYRLECYSYQ